MGRQILYGLFFIAIGTAVGLYVAGEAEQPPAAGARLAATREPPLAATGSVREVAELQKRLDAFTAKLANEAGERRKLEERLAELETQVASRIAPADDGSPPSPAIAAISPGEQVVTRSSEAVVAEEGTSPMERALVAAGVDQRTAADIKRRRDELTLSEMFLRDQAAREKWTDSPQFKEEMAEIERQRTSIRDEIGDDSYDRYLAAMGEPNRVTVDEVMTDSPAALAGLQPGDIVLRYGDTRIFAPGELVAETRGGTAGETVRLEILRGGRPLEIAVPRGPLGLRIGAGRSDP
jgi:hypothetical protein